MHLLPSLGAVSAALLLVVAMPQPAQAREMVGFSEPYASGTIVVKTSERALYYVLGNGSAVRYPVGVGRAGSNGAARPGSTASSCARPGRRLPKSGATSLRCQP